MPNQISHNAHHQWLTHLVDPSRHALRNVLLRQIADRPNMHKRRPRRFHRPPHDRPFHLHSETSRLLKQPRLLLKRIHQMIRRINLPRAHRQTRPGSFTHPLANDIPDRQRRIQRPAQPRQHNPLKSLQRIAIQPHPAQSNHPNANILRFCFPP